MSMKLDPKKATKEQLERAMELLAKEEERKEKIAKGEIKGSKKWSELTPEEKTKRAQMSKRYNTRNRILVRKAIEAGISVSEAEIDAELAPKA